MFASQSAFKHNFFFDTKKDDALFYHFYLKRTYIEIISCVRKSINVKSVLQVFLHIQWIISNSATINNHIFIVDELSVESITQPEGMHSNGTANVRLCYTNIQIQWWK